MQFRLASTCSPGCSQTCRTLPQPTQGLDYWCALSHCFGQRSESRYPLDHLFPFPLLTMQWIPWRQFNVSVLGLFHKFSCSLDVFPPGDKVVFGVALSKTHVLHIFLALCFGWQHARATGHPTAGHLAFTKHYELKSFSLCIYSPCLFLPMMLLGGLMASLGREKLRHTRSAV